jgi:hypothetical protein
MTVNLKDYQIVSVRQKAMLSELEKVIEWKILNSIEFLIQMHFEL